MRFIHRAVYSEAGMYGGWPANHGAWQWGNELLVGFVRGKFNIAGGLGSHRVLFPLEFVQARSIDFGKTWATETTGISEAFESSDLSDPPAFDLSAQDTIIRVRGNYDHGGDNVAPEGGFWLSENRGRNWSGPYRFAGLDFPDHLNTSRTCVVGNSLYMSRARKRHWGSDEIFRTTHDGSRFASKAACIPYNDARAVMPSVVAFRGGYVMACRRRSKTCWIDAYTSRDGINWDFAGKIADTGANNGNPPALAVHDGMLVCAFGDRTRQAICMKASCGGKSWGEAIVVRENPHSEDLGYPQILKAESGILIAYYWDGADRASIEATEVHLR